MSHDMEHPHDDHAEITVDTLRTPPVRINPAHLRVRMAAALIDSLIIGLGWFVLTSATNLSLQHELGDSSLLLAICTFAYYFLLEGLTATTIGKRGMKLHVVDQSGDPVTLKASLIRNLFRFIDWLPAFYIVGLSALFFSSQRKRVGDTVAGTVVTAAPEKDINPPPAPFLFH